MKRIIVLLAVFGLVVAACSSTPSVEDASKDLCDNLGSLEQAAAGVEALTPESTTDDADAALDTLKSAWNDVKDSASALDEAATDDAQQAFDDASSAVDGISGDATMAEAATTVQQAGAQYKAALDKIAAEANCGS
jgi:predicted small secreted protein